MSLLFLHHSKNLKSVINYSYFRRLGYLTVGTFDMLMYQTDVSTIEDESFDQVNILNPPANSPSEQISSFLPAKIKEN